MLSTHRHNSSALSFVGMITEIFWFGSIITSLSGKSPVYPHVFHGTLTLRSEE